MVCFKILAFCGAGLARLFEILSVFVLFHLIFLCLLARALKILKSAQVFLLDLLKFLAGRGILRVLNFI